MTNEDGHNSISARQNAACHSCSKRLSSSRLCPSCGHESCVTCSTGELAEEAGSHPSIQRHYKNRQGEEAQSHGSLHHNGAETPRPLSVNPPRTPSQSSHEGAFQIYFPPEVGPLRGSVRSNRFPRSDKNKTAVTEAQVNPYPAIANPSNKLSDCIPLQKPYHDDQIVTRKDSWDRPSAAGECVSRQAAKHHVEPGLKPLGASKTQDSLQAKIDQLYHHAQDLKHSQHIMEHLAAGSQELDTRTTGLQNTLGKTSPKTQSIKEDDQLHVLPHGDKHTLSRDMTSRVLEEGSPPTMHRISQDITQKVLSPSPEQHNIQDDIRAQPESSPAIPHEIDWHQVFGQDPFSKIAQWQISRPSSSESPNAHRPHIPPLGEPKHKGSATRRRSSRLRHHRRAQRASLPKLSRRKSAIREKGKRPVGHSNLPDRSQNRMIRWPQLRKVRKSSDTRPITPEPQVPWTRGFLRKVSMILSSPPPTTPRIPELSIARSQLRKVETKKQEPHDQDEDPPLVPNWRDNLKQTPATPVEDDNLRKSCIVCNPPRTASSLGEEGARGYDPGFSAMSTTPSGMNASQSESSQPEPAAKGNYRDARKVKGGVNKNICTREWKTFRHVDRGSAGHSTCEKGEVVTEYRDSKVPHQVDHNCKWRQKYNKLRKELDQMKSELSFQASVTHGVETIASSVHQMPPATPDREKTVRRAGSEDGLGLQGLTIVMHMKGKDDLVINTDLTGEASTSETEWRR